MDEKQIKYGHLIRSNIDTDIIELIDNVNNRGGHVYIVGGFIRDSLLMRPSTDMDLEVHNLEFDELCDILKNYSSLDIQGQFGVIKCHYFKNMEIAIPRKETKIGLKHADFKVNFDPFMGT